MPTELSPAAMALLASLRTPHSRDWGGAFVRYDSPEELACQELRQAGLAEVFTLHTYGITVRATAAGLDQVQQSVAELRSRLGDVRLGPIEASTEIITFTLDGRPYRGRLRGRNRDLGLGADSEADKAIALRVLLDGDAEEVPDAAFR